MSESLVASPRIQESWQDLIKLTRPKKIVEFGSWHGRGTIGLLELSRREGLNPLMLCVDTWLGSKEHWEKPEEPSSDEWSHLNLQIRNGEPQFINFFKRNVEDSGFGQQVEILRCPTQFSESKLRSRWADADLCYVDADHSLLAVYQDISLLHRCCPDATIFGDDYLWSGVRLALAMFATRNRLKVFVDAKYGASQWVIVDRGDAELQNEIHKRGWRRRRPISMILEEARIYLGIRLPRLLRITIDAVRSFAASDKNLKSGTRSL